MGMKTPIIFHYDKNLNLVDDEKVENWKYVEVYVL